MGGGSSPGEIVNGIAIACDLSVCCFAPPSVRGLQAQSIFSEIGEGKSAINLSNLGNLGQI